MVAHDRGGPLTILNGYISLVLEGSLRVEQLEPYLPTLTDQLEHMQRLVAVLLDTARLEEGRVELRLEPLDLVEFVEAMARRMRRPETGHQLVVRRETSELPILAEPNATTKSAGVGLGLFLSRELARLHGGDLDAASEVGKGSRFTLRLPLRDAGVR